MKKYSKIPRHIGVIPDGNRRWAVNNGMEKQDGYKHGIDPGITLIKQLIEFGVEEVSIYGFTVDNTKRRSEQKVSFIDATIKVVNQLIEIGATVRVVGNTSSKNFPQELKQYANVNTTVAEHKIVVNVLANYDWKHDLSTIPHYSKDVNKIDVVMRWGGRTRLSGFLPIQTVYADIFIIDHYWPDFKETDIHDMLDWYQNCDVTLGG